MITKRLNINETSSDNVAEILSPFFENGTQLEIIGGNTRSFLGGFPEVEANIVDFSGFKGITSYEPSELVISSRSGTTLNHIQTILSERGQMLPFEPPQFGIGSTIGGLVASGLSGPRRVMHGPVRDHILGIEIIDGRGKLLRFGGKVIKNVAGFDVSRLLVGSYGTLGMITEVSIKVLPKPERESTQLFELDLQSSLDKVRALNSKPIPVSASTWIDGVLYLRLSGTDDGVRIALAKLGGETEQNDRATCFWKNICNLSLPALQNTDRWLWRVSLPGNIKASALDSVMVDWHGRQRWVLEARDDTSIFSKAIELGGHATCFSRDRSSGSGFQPPSGSLGELNRKVRSVLDPHFLLNRNKGI